MLKACIEARAALAELKQAAELIPNQAMLINTIPLLEAKDKGIAQRQAASRYLHDLAALGVLRTMPFGKERLFIHPKLMELLSSDGNEFQAYG